LRPDTTINLALALNDCPSAQDLSRFGTYGTIGYRSKFISVVQLLGVTAANAVALGADSRVAEVFPDLLATAFLDVSVPAMGVTASAAYSPLTIADKYPGTTGANVGIVIMDSGVDDVQHVTFAGGRYVGGYDFANNIPGNPDDQQGHGTHVAGIALGSALPYRGVAPSAKLIDMRVMTVGGFPIMRAVRAIDSCIVQRKAWNIRVLNASFGMDQYPDGSDAPSNGLDPLSQAFDAAVRAGIVVVAAAGNSGHALIGWGPASSEAITVAASDDRSTVSRNDDVIAAFSSRGPRQDNHNGIASDEQKPDITAPGTAALSINPAGYRHRLGGVQYPECLDAQARDLDGRAAHCRTRGPAHPEATRSHAAPAQAVAPPHGDRQGRRGLGRELRLGPRRRLRGDGRHDERRRERGVPGVREFRGRVVGVEQREAG
jgi:hypothetical protein